jgi:hypothetical protein
LAEAFEEAFEVVLAALSEVMLEGGDEAVIGGDGVKAGVVDGLGKPFVDFQATAKALVQAVGTLAELLKGGGFGAALCFVSEGGL